MDREAVRRRTASRSPCALATPSPTTGSGANRFQEFCGNGQSPRRAATLLNINRFYYLVSHSGVAAENIDRSQLPCNLMITNYLSGSYFFWGPIPGFLRE